MSFQFALAVVWCVGMVGAGTLMTRSAVAARAASTPAISACLPTTQELSAGFDLAGVGRLGAGYPHLPRIGVDSAMVPPVILKAIAWTESGWQQFNSDSLPLLSPDYGYGAMQITSGMAGAAGMDGALPLSTQARVGGDYLFNIAYAARMLAENFKLMPQINNGDPTRLEDWYYAIWAYNGWGWVNNPNNPGFSRVGTPASDPSNFPYQERVYYLVQHPPLDAYGRPLWTPMRVTLPADGTIGENPGALSIEPTHQELPHLYGATYDIPENLTEMSADSSAQVAVTVYNTSGVPWQPAGGQPSFGLLYHWVKPAAAGSPGENPNLHGIDVVDGSEVAIPKDVPVGGSVAFAVTVTAPAQPGKYWLEWDMTGTASGWFSDNSVPPGAQTLTILPATQPAPPYAGPPVAPLLQGNHAKLVTTIGDYAPSTLQPGQSYSRTVLLFNPGSTTWGTGYGLHDLGTAIEQALPMRFVLSCRTVPVTIDGTAPSQPGSYDIVWRLSSPTGQLFGPDFRFRFTVPASK